VAIPVQKVIPSRFSTTPIEFAWAAAPTSPTAITWTPGDVLLAYNSSADTGYTVTIVSNPKFKRASDTITTFSVPFGDYFVFPRFAAQDDDTLTVSASNAAVLFARLGTRADPS
jgi:hypothetical protein